MSNKYTVTIYVERINDNYPSLFKNIIDLDVGHAFIAITGPDDTIVRGAHSKSGAPAFTKIDIRDDAPYIREGKYDYSITKEISAEQFQTIKTSIADFETGGDLNYTIWGSSEDGGFQCTNFVRHVLREGGVEIEGVNTEGSSAIPDSLIDSMVTPDGLTEPNPSNGTTTFSQEDLPEGWKENTPEPLSFNDWLDQTGQDLPQLADGSVSETTSEAITPTEEALLQKEILEQEYDEYLHDYYADNEEEIVDDGKNPANIDPDDIIGDEEYHDPTSEEEKAAAEKAIMLQQNIGGVAGSALFMSYANYHGWMEEDWLDEQWEQTTVSSIISELGKDAVALFQGDAGAAQLTLDDYFSAEVAQGLGTSIISQGLMDELGITGGQDLASQVGTTAISTTISSMTTSAITGNTINWGDSLMKGPDTVLGSIGNAVGGVIGSYAASQILVAGTEAEVYGQAVGGAVGSMLGSVGGPLASAFGSYLGSVVGDTLGETWNEVSDILDDFDVGDLSDWGDLLWEGTLGFTSNLVSSFFGIGEDKPPPPEANIVYNYNVKTGKYELTSEHSDHGGDTKSIKQNGKQISDQLEKLMNQVEGSGQLANRHDMPELKLGYGADGTFIMINGSRLGELDDFNIQKAMGEVLNDMVVEGGSLDTNRLLDSDLAPEDLLAVLTQPELSTAIAYFKDPKAKELMDQQLEAQGDNLDAYETLLSQQSNLEQQVSEISSLAYTERVNTGTREDPVDTYKKIQPRSQELFELKAELNSVNQDLQTLYSKVLQEQITDLEEVYGKLETKQQDEQSKSDGSEEISNQLNSQLKSIEHSINTIKEELGEDNNIDVPKSLEGNHQLRTTIESIENSGIGSLNKEVIESLNLANKLDGATRIEYDIKHHNRQESIKANNDSTHEADYFSLENTDLSNLVLIQNGDSFTILNRTGFDMTTPLESLPSITLEDFATWNNKNINLNFKNKAGDEVETQFDLGTILSKFEQYAEVDSTGETFDMAEIVASYYATHNGEAITPQEALNLRFAGSGIQSALGKFGTAGDDLIFLDENDLIVNAGSGDDTIVKNSEQGIIIDGGEGTDTVSYVDSNSGVTVDLQQGKGSGGDAEGDAYTTIENVVGSDHNDTLMGDSQNNILFAGKGDDTLVGSGGGDTLLGGEGNDTVDYSNSQESIRVNLSKEIDGKEVAGMGTAGDAKGDRLSGIENVIGSDGDDFIFGNAEDNHLSGGAGDDTLKGGLGNDLLEGGSGSDQLFGGSGDDTLIGGEGDDMLMGGAGNDTISTGSGNAIVTSGSGDDTIDARGGYDSGQDTNGRLSKYIDGGSGNDSVTLDGSLNDYEIFKVGDGYQLRSDTQKINLFDVENVYFDSQPLELEHLYHQKIEKELAEQEEDEADGSIRRSLGVIGTSGGISAAALAALFSEAAASEAKNIEMADENDDLMTVSEWLASLATEKNNDDNQPQIPTAVIDTTSEETVAVPNLTVEDEKKTNYKSTSSSDEESYDDSTNNQRKVPATPETLKDEDDSTNQENDESEKLTEQQDQSKKDLVPDSEENKEEPSIKIESTVSSKAPLVKVSQGFVDEDSQMLLDINVTGQNSNEHISIYLEGIPKSAELNAGFLRPDGRWQLNIGELENLKIQLGDHDDSDITVEVLVTSYDIDTQITTSTQDQFSITVHAVADTPILSVENTEGNEDTAIALTINTSLNDNDGSETQHLIISGAPEGAELNNGEKLDNGDWKLSPKQLKNLSITPALNSAADFTLTVTSFATEENGNVTSSTQTIDVTIHAVADTPSVSVENTEGNEDTAIALTINTNLNDNDGSETQHLIISGAPEGAVLNNGTKLADGTWRLLPTQLTGLSITPALNSAADFELTVTSFATEENGNVTSSTQTIDVTVHAVADTPNLTVLSAFGLEDKAIALNIITSLNDNDGSETQHLIISGAPEGAVLNNGTKLADGTWRLLPTQLTGLSITPALNSDDNFELTITSYSTEEENDHFILTNETLPVTVYGVADAPDLIVNPALGNEDQVIKLSIQSTLTDTDESESLLITIEGIPSDAQLNKGEKQSNGDYHLLASELVDLELTPSNNSDDDLILNIIATTTDESSGSTATTEFPLPVTIHAVADTPILSVENTEGNEDTAIALNISTSLNDNDGSETQHLIISGVPEGAELNNGTKLADGTWGLLPTQLTGLNITPTLNSDDDFTLTVTSFAKEGENGDVASSTETIDITVHAVADTPILSVENTEGNEDTAIALTINTSLNDNDGSETQHLIISDVPEGAELNNGEKLDNGDWKLSPKQLKNLSITPALNSDDDFTLTVTSFATEGENDDVASSTETIDITVHAVADTPILSVENTEGNEDTAIALNISTSLNDNYGSETQHLIISGVPEGAELNNGTKLADGTWGLLPTELTGLSITPALNSDDDFTLTVTSFAKEGENGDVASSTETIDVTINALTDPVTIIFEESEEIPQPISFVTEDTNYLYGSTLSEELKGTDKAETIVGNVYWQIPINYSTTPVEGESIDSFSVFININDGNGYQSLENYGVLHHTKSNGYVLLLEQKILKDKNILGQNIEFKVQVDHHDEDSDTKIQNTGRSEQTMTVTLPSTFFIGSDTVNAGGGDDTVYGSDAGDYLFGEAGNDVLYGNHGDDIIDGGTGDDYLEGSAGNDTLTGGAGNDTLDGGAGDDTIYANTGDTVKGGSGSDHIVTNSADFTDSANITIDGGVGNEIDTVTISGSGSIYLNNQIENIEKVELSDDNNTLHLTDDKLPKNTDLEIDAKEGNDTLNYTGDGSAFDDGNYTNFEQVVINLDNNGNTLKMNNDNFWEGATINGGSGHDVLKFGASGTYDLTGVNWKSIELLQKSTNEEVVVKIDEEVNLGKFNSDNNINKIIGVDDSASLSINMTLKEFAVSLQNKTNSLDKVDDGNDTLTYDNKTYELENIDTLTMNDGEVVYLDERNNAPTIFKSNIDLGNNFYEDGTAGHQTHLTHGSFNVNNQLLANVYDIEDGQNLRTDNFTGDNITNSNGTIFKATQHFNGALDFGYTVTDKDGGSTTDEANLQIQTVNDAPIVELTTNEYTRNYNYGFGSDTSYTLSNFNIIDPDSNWKDISIDVIIGSGGATKLYNTIRDHANKEYISGLTGYSKFNDEFHWNYQTFTIIAQDESGGSHSATSTLDYVRYLNKNDVYSAYTYRSFQNIGSLEINPIDVDSTWIGNLDRLYHKFGYYDYTFNYLFNDEQKFGIDDNDFHHKISELISTAPIFLDLNEDGFELTQNYAFDYDSDGEVESGTWLANSADAVLAIDYDSDGKVTHGHEIAFADWHADAKTDLEGLQLVFDSNNDGVLNNLDERWSEFGVWQDANMNGINDDGEFKSLEEAGITSFNLSSDNQLEELDGATIYGQGSFTYADGSTGQFADSSLTYTEVVMDNVIESIINEDTDEESADTAVIIDTNETKPDITEETTILTDEDEEILSQLIEMEQWQQQNSSQALSQNEAPVIESNQEELYQEELIS